MRQTGFSLIELLIVIALLGILLAMLNPALVRARELTAATQCASNMRQQYLAFRMYADTESASRTPPMVMPSAMFNMNKRFDTYNWVDGAPAATLYDRTWADLLVEQELIAGTASFSCPRDEIRMGDTNFARLSYGMNHYLFEANIQGWGGSIRPTASGGILQLTSTGDKGVGIYGVREGDIIDPSGTILVGDRDYPELTTTSLPSVSVHYMRRGRLAIHRHPWVNLLMFDGSTMMQKYESIWGGQLGSTYRRDQSVNQHAAQDFFSGNTYYYDGGLYNNLNGGWGYRDNGGASHSNFSAKFPGWNESLPTGRYSYMALLMPHFQGFVPQPFSLKF